MAEKPSWIPLHSHVHCHGTVDEYPPPLTVINLTEINALEKRIVDLMEWPEAM